MLIDAGQSRLDHWNQPLSNSLLTLIDFSVSISVPITKEPWDISNNSASINPSWAFPLSSDCNPDRIKSNSSSLSFWDNNFPIDKISKFSIPLLSIKIPRSAPLARASLITCSDDSFPTVIAITSPPIFSLICKASSKAYESLSFVVKETMFWSIERLSKAILIDESLSGTCFIKTQIFIK